jgi:hypothetical protein
MAAKGKWTAAYAGWCAEVVTCCVPSPRLLLLHCCRHARICIILLPAAKLLAELPVSCVFPLVFGGVVYPFTGLNPKPSRFLKFLGILTLESFCSSALGLAVGAVAPSTDAAVAIGPAVMLVWIIFGGYYANPENIPRCVFWVCFSRAHNSCLLPFFCTVKLVTLLRQ